MITSWSSCDLWVVVVCPRLWMWCLVC